MDWKIFFTAFVAIFFAEFADKTQLMAIGISAKSERPFMVWLGCVLAYMIVTAIAVLLGTTLSRYIKPELLRTVAGAVFILIGLFVLFGKF